MFYGKKFLKALNKASLVFIAALMCALTIGYSTLVAAADENSLYLGGFPAGFVLNTTTVEVVGICDVITEGGVASPARNAGIKTGDIIDKINGEDVNKTSDINEFIARDYKKYEVLIIRGGESICVDVIPAKEAATGAKKLGVLVKDSINGVGTVTYIDKSANKFASLGHPVTDMDGRMVGINGGTVFGSLIYDVKKGVRGTPGELRGAFESGNVIGNARLNCACGVFGDLSKSFNYSRLIKISKGGIDAVHAGTAYIYSTVYGKEPERYEISIVKVDKHNKDNRNFVIKIEDKKLLDRTGGIVQGMSGSPIVQDGKLIGAVTHVFVIIWIPTMVIKGLISRKYLEKENNFIINSFVGGKLAEAGFSFLN